MEIKDVLTLGISLLGLTVSVTALSLQFRQHRERVRVKTTNGFFLGVGLSEPMLIVTAANLGQRAVTLSSCMLKLPDGKSLMMPPTQRQSLPFELGPGKSCSQFIPLSQLGESLRPLFSGKVKLVAQFGTESGHDFRAKPYTFDVAAWA